MSLKKNKSEDIKMVIWKWLLNLILIFCICGCMRNTKILEFDISVKESKSLYFSYRNHDKKQQLVKSIELTIDQDGKIYINKNILLVSLSTSIIKIKIDNSGTILAFDSNGESNPAAIGFLSIYKIDFSNFNLINGIELDKKGMEKLKDLELAENSRKQCVKELDFFVVNINQRFEFLNGNKIIIKLGEEF